MRYQFTPDGTSNGCRKRTGRASLGAVVLSLAALLILGGLYTYQRASPGALYADDRIPASVARLVGSELACSQGWYSIGTDVRLRVTARACDPVEDIPAPPRPGKLALSCAGSGKLAIGFVNVTVDAVAGGWKCTYAGDSLLVVSLWIPIAVVSLAFVISSPALLLRWMRSKRREPGVCSQCGYDLRGQVKPRCPECGTPFNETISQSDTQEHETQKLSG